MRYFFVVIASLFFTTLCQAQFTIENIDTSRSSLKGIDTLKSCQLVRKVMTTLINDGDAESIAMNCEVPMTIEGTTYSSTNSLSAFLAKVIKAASASKDNPRVESVVVLGRRQEMLNGIVHIDILYLLGIIEFSINGQNPQKAIVVAIRNPNNPRILGLFAD